MAAPAAGADEVNPAGNGEVEENVTEVDTVTVRGRYNRHQAGHDKVYEEDISSLYRDKDQIDLFRGTASADLFKGMIGVGIGDARNSGGIDPNIRGIQGQGRVPVTIDGAENGVTVWRGYNGANNRTYIDPMLISSIRVEKGASLTRGFESSVGGGIAIKTLEAEDILKPDRKFGADIRVEAANNMAGERVPDLNLVGTQLRGSYQDLANHFHKLPKKAGGDAKTFGHDQAARVALAAKTDRTELVAAYAYRYHGNHYAGKGGKHRYEQIYHAGGVNIPGIASENISENMFEGRSEVFNTSLNNRSFLLKGTFKPTDKQAIQLGYRRLDSRYGEIMPSRIYGIATKDGALLPQWPLSKIKMDTYTLDYRWKPENRWLDLESGIWLNKADMALQNSGGMVYDLGNYKNSRNPSLNSLQRTTILHGSLNKNTNNRWGVYLTNKMKLHDSLNLTLGGSYQYEKLGTPDDTWRKLAEQDVSWVSTPRQGKRDEYKLYFNFDWQPTDRISVNAGARYNHYSSEDTWANELLAKTRSLHDLFMESERIEWNERQNHLSKDNLRRNGASPEYTMTEEDYSKLKNILSGELGYIIHYEEQDKALKQSYIETGMTEQEADQLAWQSNTYMIPRDEYGKISRADNPFLNGQAEKNGWRVPQLSGQNGKQIQNIDTGGEADGVLARYQSLGRDLSLIEDNLEKNFEPERRPELEAKARTLRAQMAALENSGWKEKLIKRKAHAWSPTFSLSYRLADNGRLYGRWAQTTRMPSSFEDISGFSASRRSYKMKPERGTNLEIGYVHNLRDILPGNPENADIKLAWYKNTIRNPIDRGDELTFIQRDKWATSGLELSSRYDNGKFFAELGANYLLSNRVCDENQAARTDVYFGQSPKCIDGGFPLGYMYNMELPKYNFNLLVGGRFFDRKLEAGGRLTYHTGYKRSAEAKEYAQKYYRNSDTNVTGLNGSIPWHAAAIVDAYVKYNFKNDLSVEFSGTNLTNRYYFDPITRSNMPAPGRAFRFSLSKKF